MAVQIGTVISALGLVLDLAGALLLAVDLWWKRHPHLDSPDDLHVLIADLASAIQALPTDHGEQLDQVAQRCSVLALHGTAQRNREALFAGRLRLEGRWGLVLIIAGFAGQFVGTVWPSGNSPTVHPAQNTVELGATR